MWFVLSLYEEPDKDLICLEMYIRASSAYARTRIKGEGNIFKVYLPNEIFVGTKCPDVIDGEVDWNLKQRCPSFEASGQKSHKRPID